MKAKSEMSRYRESSRLSWGTVFHSISLERGRRHKTKCMKDRSNPRFSSLPADGMMSKWQQRWFVLYSSGQLQYYEAEDEKNLKG